MIFQLPEVIRRGLNERRPVAETLKKTAPTIVGACRSPRKLNEKLQVGFLDHLPRVEQLTRLTHSRAPISRGQARAHAQRVNAVDAAHVARAFSGFAFAANVPARCMIVDLSRNAACTATRAQHMTNTPTHTMMLVHGSIRGSAGGQSFTLSRTPSAVGSRSSLGYKG